jgi:hypothetical protein
LLVGFASQILLSFQPARIVRGENYPISVRFSNHCLNDFFFFFVVRHAIYTDGGFEPTTAAMIASTPTTSRRGTLDSGTSDRTRVCCVRSIIFDWILSLFVRRFNDVVCQFSAVCVAGEADKWHAYKSGFISVRCVFSSRSPSSQYLL